MRSDSSAIDWFEAGGEFRESRSRRWGPLALALSIGVLLGATLSSLAGGWAAGGRTQPLPATIAREWPERPLEPEWRWQGRAYDFRHMFRQEH